MMPPHYLTSLTTLNIYILSHTKIEHMLHYVTHYVIIYSGGEFMARPVEGKVKDHDIRVRIDEDVYSSLQRYCNLNDVNMSEAVRMAIEKFLKI